MDITDRENSPKSRARDWVFPGVRSSLRIPSAHSSFAEPSPQHRPVFLQENSLSLCLVQRSLPVPAGVGVWDAVLGAPQLPPSPHSFLELILPYFPLLYPELWGQRCPLVAPRVPGVGSEAGKSVDPCGSTSQRSTIHAKPGRTQLPCPRGQGMSCPCGKGKVLLELLGLCFHVQQAALPKNPNSPIKPKEAAPSSP